MKKQSKLSNINELIKSLYVYIVLIITLVISIFGGINLFNAIADYAVPTPYVENFDEYLNYGKGDKLISNGASLESVKSSFEESNKLKVQDEKNRGLKSIITSFGSLIIALPIFFVFQKKVNFRREKDLLLDDSDSITEEENN